MNDEKLLLSAGPKLADCTKHLGLFHIIVSLVGEDKLLAVAQSQ